MGEGLLSLWLGEVPMPRHTRWRGISFLWVTSCHKLCGLLFDNTLPIIFNSASDLYPPWLCVRALPLADMLLLLNCFACTLLSIQFLLFLIIILYMGITFIICLCCGSQLWLMSHIWTQPLINIWSDQSFPVFHSINSNKDRCLYLYTVYCTFNDILIGAPGSTVGKTLSYSYRRTT